MNRVLHVLATLNRGGAETMVMNLFKNLDKNKIVFDFVLNESSNIYDLENEARDMGANIYKIKKFNGLNIFEYKEKWNVFLKHNNKWDIIHIHNTTVAFIIIPIAKKYGIKTIVHSHTAGGSKSLNTLIKKILRFPIRFQADYLFSCSIKASKWMFGRKWTKSVIINNSIDSDKFKYSTKKADEFRKEYNISSKTKLVGHVGRFHESKNHEKIISVFKEFLNINENSVLLLAGAGDKFETIKKLGKEYGIDKNIIYLGIVKDIAKFMSALDVLLFPSIYEGFPVTLVESQSVGLPALVSDTITNEVDITDLIYWMSIYELDNKWARKLNEILNTNFEKREEYSNIIKKSGFDIEKSALELEKIYKNILREK